MKRCAAELTRELDAGLSSRRRRKPFRRGPIPVRQRVLLVDDDVHVLRAESRLLAERCEVVTVGSADEALERLRAERFDVVMTDFEMPGRDGVSLLHSVQSGYPEVKRVLVSGADPHLVAPHVLSGVVECFLAKPVNRQELLVSLPRRILR